MTTSMGRGQLWQVETTCGTMLSELQLIWDEVGESDEERDSVLLQLEQECLEVYRRKVDQANRMRAHLHQRLADIHSDIAKLASALGEIPPIPQVQKRAASLKEQLAQLTPLLEDLTRQKEERLKLFDDVRAQIQSIKSEISSSQPHEEAPRNEQDLTAQKLEELHAELQALQKEKNERLFKIAEYMDIIHDFCLVLGLDFCETIRHVHPSLDESYSNQAKSISNETIQRLANTEMSLREEKRRRMQQVQDLGTSLVELWNLMDTPEEEQRHFQHITCNIAAAEQEVVAAGALSQCVIKQAEAEVERLEQLKASKMKELILKKRTELEEICRKAHMVLDDYAQLDRAIASMESGMVDPLELLASIEEQIGNTKEEAYSRKEIMDKIEKWMAACEEESWLEEYNKDDNRYSSTRGAHLNLKRAERARATVNKIPALVDTLIMKTRMWEEERNQPFLYDGVRLLSTVEEYNILRIEREEEKRRLRDQKRLHEQLLNEQETLFGTRQSPNGRTPGVKKAISGSRLSGANTPASSRRLSLGGAMLQQASPAVPRMNGMTTPGRHVTTPAAKDSSRAKVVTPVPSSVNRMLLPDNDQNGLNSGPKGCSSYPLHMPAAPAATRDTDMSVLQRLPLSPVDAAIIRPNSNAEDVRSNSQFTSTASMTPGKPASSAILKSPLSAVSPFRSPAVAASARAVMEEENASPFRRATAEENAAPPEEPKQSSLYVQMQQQQHHQPKEYSFEERRLALLLAQHESQMSRWMNCR